MRFLPWVRVVVPPNVPPPDQPVMVWLDTGSGPGLEIRVPADERWRIWETGNGHCLLTDVAGREDAAALEILANVRAGWGPVQVDPDEQDVP
nr:hypothetical protein [Micromonospora sp. DSM 115978]